MSTRFHVDLLHPGAGARTWEDWFLGPNGLRRLALFGLACLAVLVVLLVALVLVPYWRLSGDLSAIPGLRRDLGVREADLGVLRSNLGALAGEAGRQVQWAELLTALSQQIPPTLRLQLVEATRTAPAATPGQQPGTPVRFESTLRIDALTPLRPGDPPLLEVAQFMAGLTRDPAVNRRFRLKSWEIKPGPASPDGSQLLQIHIALSERAQ